MPHNIKTEDYIREFVMILFIQKRVIILIFSGCFLLFCLIAFFWPPTYSSEARILVKHKKLIRNPEMLEKVSLSEPRVTQNDVKSEMEIVSSIDVIENTIKELQREHRIFKQNLSEQEFRIIVGKIKENLKTEVIPKSDVFKVTLYWDDPVEAEEILKTHLQTYLRYRIEIYAPNKAEAFFQKQVIYFKKKLSQIESELFRLAEQTSSPIPDEKIKSNLLSLQSLEADLNKLLNNYVEKKNFIKFVENELKSRGINCFSFIKSVNIGSFGKKLQDLLVKREKLRGIYTDASPPVRAITRQIEATSRALKAEVKRYVDGEKAKLKAMKNAIRSIMDRIEQIKKENIKLYNTALRSKDLERQLKLAEESYETFVKRWNEAKIDRSSTTGSIFSVSIISGAKANLNPVFPDKRVLIPVGGIVSLIIGVTVGLLLEFFDHTFKRPEDIERYVGLQTIFTIPKFK
ncbi:MAG: Wzz/FepE/Etk N-terminal domain-containing protein [Desulfonauticus sp.]|nr:Wzz/FepE/Etk N-terminal domain-containing protein [Desulfonauticus sp.]